MSQTAFPVAKQRRRVRLGHAPKAYEETHMKTDSYRRHLRRVRHPGVLAVMLASLLLAAPAYAVGTIVARAKLADNALALGGVAAKNWRQAPGAWMSNAHVSLSADSKLTPLMKVQFDNLSGTAGETWMSAELNATNPGKLPVTVTLRLAINGKIMPGSFASTWAPGTTQALPALFAFCKKCGAGLQAGENVLTLLAAVSGSGTLTTGTTSLFADRIGYW